MDRIEAAKQRGIEDKASGIGRDQNPFNVTYANAEHLAWQEGYETPSPLQRFMVFAWSHHEASGGMNDLMVCTDDIMIALGHARNQQAKDNLVEIYDKETGVKIYESDDKETWNLYSSSYIGTTSSTAVQAYRDNADL